MQVFLNIKYIYMYTTSALYQMIHLNVSALKIFNITCFHTFQVPLTGQVTTSWTRLVLH